MFFGNNYSNNTQYNYINKFPNQNYLTQSTNNNLKLKYINSNNNKFSSNKYKLNNSYNQTAPPRKKRVNKKNVSFNQNIMVIKVQSYKEYNKLDDDINLENILNNDVNKQKPSININKKKGDNCECIII